MWPLFAWFGLAGIALVVERRHRRGAVVGLLLLLAASGWLAVARPLFMF
jgi:hypothetical protein